MMSINSREIIFNHWLTNNDNAKTTARNSTPARREPDGLFKTIALNEPFGPGGNPKKKDPLLIGIHTVGLGGKSVARRFLERTSFDAPWAPWICLFNRWLISPVSAMHPSSLPSIFEVDNRHLVLVGWYFFTSGPHHLPPLEWQSFIGPPGQCH